MDIINRTIKFLLPVVDLVLQLAFELLIASYSLGFLFKYIILERLLRQCDIVLLSRCTQLSK